MTSARLSWRHASLASPLVVCATTTVATFGFGWLQNRAGLVGGDISLAKVLWLNLTILNFLICPYLWSRRSNIRPRLRTIFGVIFASFLVRAAIELPILYLTDWWKCSYGIAHDLTVAVAAGALYIPARGPLRGPDRRAEAALLLAVALLLVEAIFAYMFCAVAEPSSGVYFAGEAHTFRTINQATWAVVVPAYLALSIVLWRSRNDFTAKPAPAH